MGLLLIQSKATVWCGEETADERSFLAYVKIHAYNYSRPQIEN